jgi:hypothetical protein
MPWLLYFVGPFVLAVLLGASTEIRIRRLLLPALALALVYWVAVGWRVESHELDRAALLLITGVIGAVFVLVWIAGTVIGRVLRDAGREP